ncbi:hypothetical protein GF412_04650 [Candidatus Micrarchaeota archaeon]|nr:hypothetical protein [Candidatus Micrarchaeota archaeon]MBD3418242.1 hypothetical protein [Candidatus Micrarchaeota archaeon]
MRALHNRRESRLSTLPPGQKHAPSRAKGNEGFFPRVSVLLEDIGEPGPVRSEAIRDIKRMLGRLDKEELWGSARALLNAIKDKDAEPFERMEAIDAIVPVLNAIHRKIAKEENEGEVWSAESQVPVQGALPKVHPGAVLHADKEEEAAEKKRFGKREGIREQALIGALNSVALVETFDNKEIADSVRLAIGNLESPHAKKLVNRRALNGLMDPMEAKPGVRTEEPSGHPKKKASIEELFGLDREDGFSGVG